jgi:hypothetical protein
MGGSRQILEGRWEEITRRANDLAGKWVRVEVLERGRGLADAEALPFYATATRDERIRALREWAKSHRRDLPPLSDDAISRESIYFGEE